jgi:hypothetical protein
MEFGAAEDRFGLERLGEAGVGILEVVDLAVALLLEAPSTAEIDDANAVFEPGGHPLAGVLVREGEEDDVDLAFRDEVPGEGADWRLGAASPEGELRMQIFQRNTARR